MLEKVKEEYQKHPKTRVLFYFDADGSNADDLANWNETETDITLVVGNDHYFGLKYRLHEELKDKRVLLYFPFAKPTGEAWENYPLRGLFHANREP